MAQQATFTITAVDGTRQAFESVARGLEGLNKAAALVGKGLALGFLGHEVASFVQDVVSAGIKFERSQNLMQATLKATGYAAGLTTTELEDMGKALSEATTFDPQDIRSAETALLRFRNLHGETFREALKLTADYAAGTNRDLSSAAQTIGRASQGSARDLRALAETIPHFTERNVDYIRSLQEAGRTSEVTAVVFEHIKAAFGGLAEAENKGLLKETKSLTKAWDEFLISLGKSQAVGATAGGTLNFLSTALKELDQDLERLKDAKGIGEKIGELAAALDPRRAFGLQDRPKDVVEPTDPEQLAKQRVESAKAAAGLIKAEQERAKNLAYQKQQEALKNNVALTKASGDAQTANMAQSAQEQTAVLKAAYDRGEIDLQTHYDALAAIQKNALTNERVSIQGQIAAQEALLGALSTTKEQKPGIRAELTRLRQEDARKRQAVAYVDIDTAEKIRAETEKLANAQDEIDARLAEQTGDLAKADRLRAQQRYRAEEYTLKQGGYTPDAARTYLTPLKQAEEGQRQYNKALRDTTLAQQEFANKERDITSQVAAGQISEFEGLAKLDAARKEAVVGLTAYADAQESAAEASKNPEAIQAVRNLRSEIKALAATADESTKQMRVMLEDSLNGPLIDFVNHTKSAKDEFLDFAKNVEQALLRMSVQDLSKSLFSGGSTGGGVGAIAPYLAGLFGGGGGAAAAASGSSLAAAQAGTTAAQYAAYFAADGGVMTPHGMIELKRYAGGGIASRPQLALFGEGRQNEAFVPLPDGRRIPVAMKGGGGNVQHLTVNIATPDAQSFKRSESQVITSIAMAGRRAMARR